MTRHLRWLLQIGWVALLSACGGSSSDDIVIRTDTEAAAGPAAPAVAGDKPADSLPAVPAADLRSERGGR